MTGPVRAVLFDAGNTLVYLHPGRMAELLRGAGASTGPERIRTAELAARKLLHDAVDEGHVGTEPEVWRAYFRDLFRRAGVPEGSMEEAGRRLRETHARDHLWTHVEPGTTQALQQLAALGYRLAVISNADGRVEDVLREVGLRRHFEFVIDSQVLGIEKPDPAIFLEGSRRLGLPPEACVYVGDLFLVDYRGARAAGMEAVLLDPLGLHAARAPTVAALGELAAHLDGAPGRVGPGMPTEFPTVREQP